MYRTLYLSNLTLINPVETMSNQNTDNKHNKRVIRAFISSTFSLLTGMTLADLIHFNLARGHTPAEII